jgi:hypothetical protein
MPVFMAALFCAETEKSVFYRHNRCIRQAFPAWFCFFLRVGLLESVLKIILVTAKMCRFASTAAQCTAEYMSSGAQQNGHLQPNKMVLRIDS